MVMVVVVMHQDFICKKNPTVSSIYFLLKHSIDVFTICKTPNFSKLTQLIRRWIFIWTWLNFFGCFVCVRAAYFKRQLVKRIVKYSVFLDGHVHECTVSKASVNVIRMIVSLECVRTAEKSERNRKNDYFLLS